MEFSGLEFDAVLRWVRNSEVDGCEIVALESPFFRNETSKSVGVNVGVLGVSKSKNRF